jgi:hypothetical protein
MAERIDFDTTGVQPIEGRIDFDPTGVQEVREVGTMETAGRTIMQSVRTALRAWDMAAAGLAGAFGASQDQEAIFRESDARKRRMDERYGFKGAEEPSMAGQIVGGLASLPVEVLGGMGAQHGVERAADIVERGGSMEEAARGGVVSGAGGVALNLLPAAAGLRAAERSGLGRAGRTAVGAATGAAINVPAEVGLAVAENAALPDRPEFKDLERDPLDTNELTVSGGLSAGIGALAGGMSRGRGARPARRGKGAATDFDTAAEKYGFEAVKDNEGKTTYRTPSGAFVTPEDWNNASDRRKQMLVKPAEAPAADGGEPAAAKEPAGPTPEQRDRLLEIERLRAEASPEVQKVLDAERAKLEKEIEGQVKQSEAQRTAADLERAASATADKGLQAALRAAAQKAAPAEKIPVGEAKEIAEPAPTGRAPKAEKLPVPEAKEVIDQPAKAEKIPSPEAKELTQAEAKALEPSPKETDLLSLLDKATDPKIKADLTRQLDRERKRAADLRQAQEYKRLADETLDPELHDELMAKAHKLGLPKEAKPAEPKATEGAAAPKGRHPVLQIIAKGGGISTKLASDITSERGFRANAGPLAGLFRKKGGMEDRVAEMLHQAGYISDADMQAGNGERAAIDIVQRVARGENVLPVGEIDDSRVRQRLNDEIMEEAERRGIETKDRTPEQIEDALRNDDELRWRLEYGVMGGDMERARRARMAAEIDEDAVERAAVQFEDDDAGFDRAIARILGDEDESQRVGESRASYAGQAADAGAKSDEARGEQPRGNRAAARSQGQGAGEARARAQVGERDASGQVRKQGGVQQERQQGNAGRQASEAGRGDRVQRAARGQEEAQAQAGQVAERKPEPQPGQQELSFPEIDPNWTPPAGKGRELAPREVEIQAKTGAVDANATRASLKTLGNKVGNVTVGKIRIEDKPVLTPMDAAQAMAPLRRDAQEHVIALVTDAAGKPLAVVRHTKGSQTSSNVYQDALFGAVSNVNGAKNVWFAHNHPSGSTDPSNADKMLTSTLHRNLRGVGIEAKGMVIMDPGGRTTFLNADSSTIPEQRTKPSRRHGEKGRELPVQETRFTQVVPRESMQKIDSPATLKAAMDDVLPGESGVLLLDSQLQVVGALEMPLAEMAKLRTGDANTGAGRLLQALGRTGATAMAVKVPGTPDAMAMGRNVGTMGSNVGVRVLDIVAGGKSAAQAKADVTNAGDFYSMEGPTWYSPLARSIEGLKQGDEGVPLQAAAPVGNPKRLDSVLREKFGDKLIDGLLAQGILKYARGADEPVPARARAVMRERAEGPAATLYWDRLRAEDAPGTLMHELGEHFGIIRLLGEDRYRAMLEDLREMRKEPEVARAWERVAKNYRTADGKPMFKEGDERFMREVAAHLVEEAPNLGWVRKLVNAIRAALYQMGLPAGKVDANLLRGLATAALRKAAQGDLQAMREPMRPMQMAGLDDFAMPMAGLPDTITVNGKQRPTRNSEGQPIHPTEDGIRNFWRWFGDSKVVDAEGNPLVVYHGTDGDFSVFDREKSGKGPSKLGFWFTDMADFAENFGGTLMPVYASIKNPKRLTASQWDEMRAKHGGDVEFFSALRDQYISEGFDGVVIPGGTTKVGRFDVREPAVYAAFSPEQIKSATGNRGTFDPSDSQINYSMADSGPRELGEETGAELLTRKFMDRFNRVGKAQDLAGKVATEADIVQADRLYHGRVQYLGEKLNRDFIEPLGKLMNEAKKVGVSVKDADDFLMALHAPERNRVIAARNPKMPDGGSGLTNAQAREIIEGFEPDQRRVLDQVAKLVHKMNREKLDLMVDSGLITPETRDTLNKQYRYYVPLKTLDEEDAARGIGRGYELRATDITTAMGRGTKAGSPIAASVMDASRAIMRSEKARVDRTIWNFANTEGGSSFMRPYDPENPPREVMGRKIGPDGQVKDVVDPIKVQDLTINVMVDGESRRVFVPDQLLRDQIRNVATANDPGPVLRAIGRATGTIGRLLTEFNPNFTLPNAVRDAITVVIRAKAHGVKPGEVTAQIPVAWKAIADYKRGADTELARQYEEFLREGGKTGAYGIRDVIDTMADLEKAGAQLGYDQYEAKAWRKAARHLGKVAEAVSSANEVVEYGARFALYRKMRENGATAKDAAAAAKEVTVNFNRSGEYGRMLNSVLVFANAALQGLYGTIMYMKNPSVRRGMLGLVALGAATQMLNEMLGGENEETGERNINTQSDAVADKNVVLLYPGTSNGVKIPLPPEYAGLYGIGRRLWRMFSQGDVGREAAGVVANIMDSTLPVRIPDADSGPLAVAKAVTPTLAAPFVDIWTNQNYFGSPIVPERRFDQSPPPYFTVSRQQTSELAKAVSELLNTATGGDEIEPGKSQEWLGPLVSPEGIEHLVSFYTGGLGQFVMQATNLAKPEKRELNRTPVVSRFIFTEPKGYTGRRYREITPELQYAKDRLRLGQDIPEKLDRALPEFEAAERELRRLYRDLRERAQEDDTVGVEQVRAEIKAAQSRVIRAYNGQPLQ